MYTHSLVKPDLTLSEYRQFHRPRLPLIVVDPARPWQFQTKVVVEKKGARKSKASNAAADGSTIVGSYNAMMSAGAKGQSKMRNEVRFCCMMCWYMGVTCLICSQPNPLSESYQKSPFFYHTILTTRFMTIFQPSFSG